jgi:enoyl-CoA hydratase/carnithine racemase
MALEPLPVQEPMLVVERPEPGVLWLRLNRPAAGNALDRALGEAVFAALHRAPDEGVRVAVLTGAGKAFCAGDDLRTVDAHLAGERTHSPVVGTTDDPIYLRIVEAIVSAPFPVVAAVNGAAAGAGTEIACAADLRIASSTARIGSCLVNVAQVGTALMLGRVVGEARATEIYLSGRLVEMEEALRIGLVHEVVEPALLEAAVLERARTLAQRPTKAIALYKELRERLHGESIEHGLRLQNSFHVRNNREVEDSLEGARAFLDKRTPRFTGR